MRFLELHTVAWGPIVPINAEPCIRLTSTLFDVHVDLTRTDDDNYWVTGLGQVLPPHELPITVPLLLSAIPGTFVAVIERDNPDPQYSGITVQIRLDAPMPVVAFEPDPALAVSGGVAFEEAMRLASPEGRIFTNWITEDADAWYFNAFCIGPGGTRVSKRDGSVSRVPISKPIPGYIPRR